MAERKIAYRPVISPRSGSRRNLVHLLPVEKVKTGIDITLQGETIWRETPAKAALCGVRRNLTRAVKGTACKKCRSIRDELRKKEDNA